MKIIVKAKPNSKMDKVERVEQETLPFGGSGREGTMPVYKVSVKARAVEGRANEAIVSALAEYFGVRKSEIALVSGETSKQKVFEVSGQ